MAALEWPGRRRDGVQTAASTVCDFVDSQTALFLCSFCQPKFNPKKNKYRARYVPDYSGKTSGYIGSGRCDACSQMCMDGKLFIHEEYWKLVSNDPGEVRAAFRSGYKPRWRDRFTSKFRRS
jgi:hypothetical protein